MGAETEDSYLCSLPTLCACAGHKSREVMMKGSWGIEGDGRQSGHLPRVGKALAEWWRTFCKDFVVISYLRYS